MYRSSPPYQYIAFVDRSNNLSGSVNLLDFFNYVISRGWMPSSSTLYQICNGVELVSTNSRPEKFPSRRRATCFVAHLCPPLRFVVPASTARVFHMVPLSRLSTGRRLQFLAVLLLFSCRPAQAGIVTVDFETFPDGTPIPDSTSITTQFPGLIFTNTTVITAGISLNEFEFPPHSGTNVAFDDGGPISIDFASPISSFSTSPSVSQMTRDFDTQRTGVVALRRDNPASRRADGPEMTELPGLATAQRRRRGNARRRHHRARRTRRPALA